MGVSEMEQRAEERRRYPRAEISLNGVLVSGGDKEVEIESINISESGMLIGAKEPLDEFTIISAVMRLSGPGNGREDVEVYCEGVVVRIEYDNASEYPYHIAVHFSRLDREARMAIREMVQRTNEGAFKFH
jgi:hypothetical protein